MQSDACPQQYAHVPFLRACVHDLNAAFLHHFQQASANRCDDVSVKMCICAASHNNKKTNWGSPVSKGGKIDMNEPCKGWAFMP
jgi:hypothetical protein